MKPLRPLAKLGGCPSASSFDQRQKWGTLNLSALRSLRGALTNNGLQRRTKGSMFHHRQNTGSMPRLASAIVRWRTSPTSVTGCVGEVKIGALNVTWADVAARATTEPVTDMIIRPWPTMASSICPSLARSKRPFGSVLRRVRGRRPCGGRDAGEDAPACDCDREQTDGAFEQEADDQRR